MKQSLYIWCVLMGVTAFGQIKSREIDLERIVDEIVAVQDEDINYEDLYENLMQLYAHPMDLNRVNEEQLRSLFILNEIQIRSLLSYREDAGPFLSVYELQNIDGITKEVFQKITPFLTVRDASERVNKSLLQRIVSERNNYLIIRHDRTLEEKRGYSQTASPSGRYIGSPDRLYTRFRTSRPGDFSIGFTAEKDPGEQIVWSPVQKQYGPDFLSYHLQVMNKGRIKNLIVGDYQVQFGQGLVLGSAFGIGKNSEAVTTIRRANVGFLPYTSLYEAGYLRGTALSFKLNNSFTIHGMYSSRWRDGNLTQDTTEFTSQISSISFTGLHRTPTELANRNTIRETNIATVISYSHRSLDAGVILHQTNYSAPLMRAPTLYNQFYFEGDENKNAGMYLNYGFKNFSFFSEFAHTLGYGSGITGGIVGSLTPSLDVSVLYRKFDRNFYSFYSNALAESTTPQNEEGIYWGWKYLFNQTYSFSGYVDFFRFPWLRYRSYAPSQGSEWLMRFNYRPSKQVSLFVQAREETKSRNIATESNLYQVMPGTKRNYWINLDYVITPNVTMKTRAQFSSYRLNDNFTQGMMVLQDITWSVGRFSLSGRHALFDTDDYDNRLYVFEKDAWLAFSFPAYFGVGVRNYALLQFSVTRNIDVWLRWARTRFTDRETIGSGSETIQGNTRNDVKFQARIRL